MKLKRLLILINLIIICSSCNLSENIKYKKTEVTMEKDIIEELYQKYATELEFIMKQVKIPNEYNLKSVEKGKHNSENVLVFRFDKSSQKKINLGGEHFSITLKADTFKILGFTYMDKKFKNIEEYISKEEVRKQAEKFLDNLEPGLF